MSREDFVFFKSAGPFALSRLAEFVQLTVTHAQEDELILKGIAPLETATIEDISFLDNRKYASTLSQSKAGACILPEEMVSHAPPRMAMLVSDNPYLDYARVASRFYPDFEHTAASVSFVYEFEQASIAASASIGEDCRFGRGVVIGEHVRLGKSCRIAPYAVIGDGVVMGDDCAIDSHTHIQCTLMGDRVRVQSGARIGEAGFGFAVDKKTGRTQDVPQVGRVTIGNDCLIGANSTIARGSLRDTVIGDGCRIDNLVQIAHNVRLGRGCVVVSQVGISGSTELGDFCMVGGQAGLAGHLKIGAGAQIAAAAGLMRDVPVGGKVGGIPAVPVTQWHRQTTILKKLAYKK